MNGGLLMKLITVNHHRVHVTDNIEKVTGSKVKLRNMVSMITPEPLHGFQPKFAHILPTLGT